MNQASSRRRSLRVAVARTGPDAWYGVPPIGGQHVSRPRLLQAMARSETVPLVVVSAPAGTGKTSLVAEWARTLPAEDVGWVTFDPDDEAFWPALAGCLERLGVDAAQRSYPAHAAPLGRQALMSLGGALAGLPRRVTVVVDGYELSSAQVATDVDFLLRHCGHRLRLVVVTRADPVLPLYRYRLRDTMTEVRLADLAFTDGEAEQLLQACSVHLGRESLTALNVRLSGWAVGLRFAARILAKRPDPDLAVREVVADSGNIGEYLVGEVLDAQSPQLRSLLLSTCVPDRLRPGLAEVLAGTSTSRAVDLLTRANAFIEAVPGHPGHFRYQPFFRDLLRAELAFESPELMRRLQRTAAEWFADHGLVEESVSHYVAIEFWADAAAEVVDSLAVGDLLVRPATPLAKALQAIPDRLDNADVHLVRAGLALGAADRDAFEEELDLAVRASPAESGAHRRAVRQNLAVLRAVGSRFVKDSDLLLALALAGEAEVVLSASDSQDAVARHPELLGLVLAAKGRAREIQGWLVGAHEAFEGAARWATGPPAALLRFECLSHLAALACFRGEIASAESFATRALTLGDSVGIPTESRSGFAAGALAWVGVERSDLHTAVKWLEVARTAHAATGDPVSRTLLGIVASRVRVAHGDIKGALAVLDEASICVPDRRSWLMDKLRIEKGRIRLTNGEASVALLDVEAIDAGGDAEVAVVRARAQLSLGDTEVVVDSLAPALARSAPVTTQVEGWLVEAGHQLHGGSTGRARTALTTSLTLAAGARLRRPFREAHPAVRQLLSRDRRLQAKHPWLGIVQRRPVAPVFATSSSRPPDHEPPGTAPTPVVVEKLTQKELEVLGLLSELLTTEEIASSMFVSVNTIRTHVRSILRKLGVSRRNAAVRRARELELLPA
jgi:LuxR family transcriptional regulator, maltose regulon positive regulatory protein